LNLLLVLTSAYFTAGVVNQMLSQQINRLLASQAKAASSVGVPRLASKSKSAWAKTISDRNLFNATPPSPEDLKVETSEDDPAEERDLSQLPAPYETCEDSKVSAQLKSTLVASPSTASYAMVEVDKKERIFQEGDTLLELEIVAIQWNGGGGRIVLKGTTSPFECLTLERKRGKRSRPSVSSRNNKSSRVTKPSRSNKFKEGIKEVSPGRYEVDRAMLDEQLSDLDSIIKQARAIPHYTKGKMTGFKVIGIRSNSIFRHLGLKSGDVLKSVGGEELTTLNKALGLFDKLKSSDNVSIELDRRGKAQDIEYNIK
jgi:general secretion pathway protein C